MDLFDIRIRLSTVLNVYIFGILKAVVAQFYQRSLLRVHWLCSNPLIYLVNRPFAWSSHVVRSWLYCVACDSAWLVPCRVTGSCKGPIGKHARSTIFYSHIRSVIIIFFLSFLPLITRQMASFTVKRPFNCLHSISRDGMSKDGQKMSPMHITLKVGVKRNF